MSDKTPVSSATIMFLDADGETIREISLDLRFREDISILEYLIRATGYINTLEVAQDGVTR